MHFASIYTHWDRFTLNDFPVIARYCTTFTPTTTKKKSRLTNMPHMNQRSPLTDFLISLISFIRVCIWIYVGCCSGLAALGVTSAFGSSSHVKQSRESPFTDTCAKQLIQIISGIAQGYFFCSAKTTPDSLGVLFHHYGGEPGIKAQLGSNRLWPVWIGERGRKDRWGEHHPKKVGRYIYRDS